MARRGMPVIDRERCKGCLLCTRACPVKILGPDSQPNSWGYYPSTLMDETKCIACGNCYQVCPDVAITVYRD